jgi:2-succinyl-6-hydroxy-2,4-cyclohexadiene-1-carboxylate synthase
MPKIEINGVVYHYLRTEGRAPGVAPLLLLHGFTGSSSNWAFLAESSDRTILAPDLLGHGATDAPVDPKRYAMEQAAADLAEFIQMQSTAPVHLLGYSMGGRLALYIALTYPELLRSLSLESASPGLDDADARAARRRDDAALAAFIETEGVTAFVTRWEGAALFASQRGLPPAVRDGLRRQRLANRPAGLANSLRGMGTGSQPSLWSRLKEVSCPTLLVAGALDAKFCAINRIMAAQMTDARLTVLPDAGHTVHLEEPQAFTAAVHTFLQEVEAGGEQKQ